MNFYMFLSLRQTDFLTCTSTFEKNPSKAIPNRPARSQLDATLTESKLRVPMVPNQFCHLGFTRI
jgi:hypothetical protein